jgi:hypothetical protein
MRFGGVAGLVDGVAVDLQAIVCGVVERGLIMVEERIRQSMMDRFCL